MSIVKVRVADADYRSPTSGSAAAATAPARLAREYDDVRWREVPGGGIEVAVRDGIRIERLRVLDDGSTSLVERFALRPIAHARAFAKRSIFVALVVLGLSWIPLWGRGFQILLGLMFFAAIAGASVMKVYTWPVTLGWTRRLGSGWHRPTNLNGWVPRSSAQIATVEAIAERHGGHACVYDQGVEPLVVHACRWFHSDYWFVEDDGSSTKQARLIAVDGVDDSQRWIEILTREPGD